MFVVNSDSTTGRRHTTQHRTFILRATPCRDQVNVASNELSSSLHVCWEAVKTTQHGAAVHGAGHCGQ